MKTNYNWIQKLIFPGSEVLYPLLSLLCLFLYFFFWGRGIEFAALPEKCPGWGGWFIFAILGYVFFSLFGIIKGWWKPHFLAIGVIVESFSFCALLSKLYHVEMYSIGLVMLAIIICGVCMVKILKKDINQKFLWGLPIVVIVIYYMSSNVLIMMMSCMGVFMALAICGTEFKSTSRIICVVIGSVVFYVVSTFTYLPVNPILLIKNIKSIEISPYPRMTSLVVKDEDKYVIIDGTTLHGSSPVNLKFECLANIPPFRCSFVGFNSRKFKDTENFKDTEEVSFHFSGNLYPIIITDSCMYFTSRAGTYKVLDGFKNSESQTLRISSLILKDFMRLYAHYDIKTLEELKRHQQALHEYFIKLTCDSTMFSNNKKEESILRGLSRNLSLGMLNALCGDLIANKDINLALRVFSFQFFLTYYDTPIYQDIHNTLKTCINKSDGILSRSEKYIITPDDLKKDDTFVPWQNVSSMCIAFAQVYLWGIQEANMKNALMYLSNMDNGAMGSVQNIYDKKNTEDRKEQLAEIKSLLSDYSAAPMLSQYIAVVQSFLVQSVLMDYMPDYSAFFINRFNEITPLAPMNPASVSAYEQMDSLYHSRFTQDIKQIMDLRRQIDLYSLLIDDTIAMQDSIDSKIEGLDLNPQSKSLLKELLYNKAKSKQSTLINGAK